MDITKYSISIDASAFAFKNELIIPTSVQGIEHMHRGFSYDVRFLYPISFNTKCFTQYPSRTVNITLNSNYIAGLGNDRIINGHVLDCEFMEKYVIGTKEYWEYKLVVESYLSVLDDNITSRIYDNKTVFDIVGSVLSKYNFTKVEYPSKDKSEKIPHTKRYRESDLHFISRILQKEGISFFFDMKKGQHTMKFYRGIMDYSSQLKVSYKDIKLHVNARTKVMPAKIVHSSYNYDQPNYEMTSTAYITKTGVTEVHKHLQGQASEHDDRATTQLIQDQIKCQKAISTGYAKRIDIITGAQLSIEDGTQYGVIATKLEVIEPSSLHIKNHGQRFGGHGYTYDKLYSLDFKCMYPITVPYKPAFAFETPKVFGPQIAMVVGSPENYMDKEGRVQLRFQWDSNFSESKERLYIRVAQPSASKGAGTHFKVYPGDEVLVSFLDGDIHEPIITHALYNGKNEQSINEAGDGKNHGHSTKGGHEISHVDTAGSEEIKISSSKLLTTSAVETHAMSQKQWDVKTQEGVTMEHKQLDVKAAESTAFSQKQFENNSSETATHNQKKMNINSSESSKMAAGKISLVLDDKSGKTTLSGGSQTIVEGIFKIKGKAAG